LKSHIKTSKQELLLLLLLLLLMMMMMMMMMQLMMMMVVVVVVVNVVWLTITVSIVLIFRTFANHLESSYSHSLCYAR